ncbi:protein ORF102 [Lake sturgeon herpesvirus]|nr:protein ORF102 [Lake sturgeon herpesvirus]
MSSTPTLTYPKIIFNYDLELELLAKRVTGSVIEVRCNSDIVFEIHSVVYEQLLGRFGVLIKNHAAIGGAYTFVNASPDDLPYFLVCLYLRYLGHIDDEGRVTGYTLLDKQNCCYRLQPLIIYYHLTWLKETACNHVVQGPIFKRGQELVLADLDSQSLAAVGLPPHNLALTVTVNGRLWYALCAPRPDLLQLWIKVSSSNCWTVISQVADPFMEAIETCQLTLAQNTCLYVLLNNQSLLCYNLINRTWVKVAHNKNYCLPYVMAETGDESLPLTLVVNNKTATVFTTFYNAVNATMSKTFVKQYKNLNYSSGRYKLVGAAPRVDVWPDQDSLSDVRKRLNIIYQACPRRALIKRLAESGCDGCNDADNALVQKQQELLACKRIKVDTLTEGLVALTRGGRPAETGEFDIPSQKDIEDQYIACDPQLAWSRVLVKSKKVYGQRVNGEWLFCEVIGKEITPWQKLEGVVSAAVDLGYNHASNDEVASIEIGEGANLAVNGRAYNLDLHNPNFSDYSPLLVTGRCEPYAVNHLLAKQACGRESGLEALVDCHALQTPEGKLKFVYNAEREVSPALHLFLHSSDPTELLSNKGDLTYFNGGLKRLSKTHIVTGNALIELYVSEPPSSQVVQAANLEAFVKSRFVSQPLKFVAFGEINFWNFNGTEYNFNCNQRSRFVFYKKNTLVATLEELV